jgi:catechol 2,3-dioxygenase-like lactoylglutathione lyase family enzyme
MEVRIVDWTLELVLLPVTDVDRAKAFYLDKVGFRLDVDHSVGDDFRIVQMTPPGSACSIGIGIGIGNADSPPGCVKGLHLIVPDIEAGRAELVGRGVDASEIWHIEAGKQVSGPEPNRSDYNSFLNFDDPDGNTWVVQEVRRGR